MNDTERKIKSYDGSGITVTFEAARCYHAKECVRGLPEVFDIDKRPWIQPQHADADRLAQVVRRCPSGALKFRRDDGANETEPERNVVTVTAAGPIHVRGKFTVESDAPLNEWRMALCRCGLSKNKPHCDGSHFEKFDDDGRCPKASGEAARVDQNVECTSPVTLKPLPDGPVLCRGPVEIRNASGETIFVGEQAAFCRCGASSRKPFCDGTHGAVGFKS
ncbi:MAG: CDGSH iron-sulfur domain-containing protein [Deltaproteobacteria bacterium]|nr:CDGSH iron-sulfur domain-containing protein [Deltaproteobacteria bacterium]